LQGFLWLLPASRDVAAAPEDAYLWGLVVEKETALLSDRYALSSNV